MLNAKVEQAINDQINYEFYSAYIYLAMAAWLKQENYNGLSHWMRIQYLEETFHAQKQFDFVHDRDGKVTLREIAKPQLSWKSPLEVFKHAYEHEQGVTSRLGDIDELALKHKRPAYPCADAVVHQRTNRRRSHRQGYDRPA